MLTEHLTKLIAPGDDNGLSFTQALNNLALEGWELINFAPLTVSVGNDLLIGQQKVGLAMFCVFKRERVEVS